MPGINIRRKAFVSTGSDNDDDSDHVTSYCPRCEKHGFYNLLGERIYDINQPIPSDSDNWMQCHTCGTVVAKVHAKRENEIIGIKEPDKSIHDSGKVIVEAVNMGKYPISKRKEFIKNLDRPNHSVDPADSDPDLKRLLKKSGNQLINYTEVNA